MPGQNVNVQLLKVQLINTFLKDFVKKRISHAAAFQNITVDYNSSSGDHRWNVRTSGESTRQPVTNYPLQHIRVPRH